MAVFTHGASGYRGGCRCDECRRGARDRMREYQRRPEVKAKRAAKDPCRCGADKWVTASLCRKCSSAKAARAKSVFARLNQTPPKPRVFTSGPCSMCGSNYTALHGARTCSTVCAAARQAEKDASHSWWVSPSTRIAIFMRDDWTCQICQGPMEKDADPLSDWYPSLDHVVPRSKGGDHTPENLRAAHRWCNAVRGAEDYHSDLFVA